MIQQIAMMLLALALNSASAWADNENYFDPTAAVGQQTKTATNPTAITANTETLGTTGQTTWYYVSGTFTNDRRIDVLGTVNIILVDDCKFTASKGIRVESPNALNIYAQKAGDGCGKLIAKHSNNHAAIGGNRGNDGNGEAGAGETSGTITIYGGNIDVNGNIGGGDGGTGYYIGDYQGIGGNGGKGTIIIYDGHITVDGNMGGGKGGCGEGVPMYSGEYDEYGDPIVLYYNGGQGGDGGTGTVTINGGYVNVYGNMGGGYYGDGNDQHGNEGSGDVSFSWSKPSDMFCARSYNGTVHLLKSFMDSNEKVYKEDDYEDGISGDARIINKLLYPYGTMYDITIGGNYDPACLESKKDHAMEGAEIKLTAVNGYRVSSVTVTDADNGNVSVTDNQNGTWTFTMPAKAVIVTPTATRFYQVSGSNNISCDVADANDKMVQNGKTYYRPEAAVNFQVTVPDGYFIQSLTVKDEDSQDISYVANGTNAYTFTMPAKAVTMEAVTVRDFSGLTLIEGTAAFTVTGGTDDGCDYGPENLLDGMYSSTDDSNYSKWIVDDVTNGCSVEFNTAAPVVPKHYTLISTNSYGGIIGCYPTSWTIKAKASAGGEWTTIAAESDNYTMNDEQTCHSYLFDFNNSGNNAYKYFRFEVTAVEGWEELGDEWNPTVYHNWLELSEMQMYVRVTNGTCGDISINRGNDVTWKYNTSTKVLTISGTGPMMYYGLTNDYLHSTSPWSHFDGELEHVIIQDGVTSVGSYAFAKCSKLTDVVLPASLFQIDQAAFFTSSLNRIIIPRTEVVSLAQNAFDYCPAGLSIVVPSTLLKTYQTANNWSTYSDKLVGSLSETTGFNTTDFVSGRYEFKRTFKCGVSSTICLPFAVPEAQAASVGKFYSFEGIDKSGQQWTVIMRENVNEVTNGLEANKPYLFVPYIFDGMSYGDAFEFTFSGSVSVPEIAGSVIKQENANGSFWSFQGVYYNILWDEMNNSEMLGKVYGFAANSYSPDDNSYTVNPGDFVKAGAGASIPSFRAFLQYTGSSAQGAPMRGGTRADVSLPNSIKVKLIDANGTITATGEISTETGDFIIDTWYDMNGRLLPDTPAGEGMYIHNGNQVLIKY